MREKTRENGVVCKNNSSLNLDEGRERKRERTRETGRACVREKKRKCERKTNERKR